ncbi:hypothetical protein THRCLA_22096 [Thraustotheca clavata]|uniref:NTF2 domain-containing protein n=1 Tax=Thraustotheca clavata TaxID=74557 RepID=A0A1V9ZCA1_9STRA|nr:hypothetical protein THRCLA_22096 [Thraustotheca clavata]
MSAQEIGNAFVNHYYTTYDSNRAALAPLYSNNSTLSFDKETFQGQQQILEKLSKLPQTQHRCDTVVIQPSVSDNAILICVTGKLVIDNGNPLQFAQTFQLKKPMNGESIEKPRLTLMERQDNETGNGPMLAQLRISELDKLVARVKQKQALCLDLIAKYNDELAHIEKESRKIHERYDPLCKRLDERLTEQEANQKQFNEISKAFSEVLNTTKARLRNSQTEGLRTLRREATAELTATRGFSSDIASTFRQKIKK